MDPSAARGTPPRTGLFGEASCPSVERCSRHTEIPCHLCGGFTAVDETDGVADLTVSDPAGSPAEGEAGLATFLDGVGDAFAFDLVFCESHALPETSVADQLGLA